MHFDDFRSLFLSVWCMEKYVYPTDAWGFWRKPNSSLSLITWMEGYPPQAKATSQRAHDYYCVPVACKCTLIHTDSHQTQPSNAGHAFRHQHIFVQNQEHANTHTHTHTFKKTFLYPGQTGRMQQEEQCSRPKAIKTQRGGGKRRRRPRNKLKTIITLSTFSKMLACVCGWGRGRSWGWSRQHGQCSFVGGSSQQQSAHSPNVALGQARQSWDN